MQFLYPLGLLALAGLLVPLIIHLWNIKKGKTIKIGSIAFLSESARTSSKSLRITDVLLWVLRSLLLVLIALFLSQPIFVKEHFENQKANWILIKPNLLKDVVSQHAKKIDSLTKRGYELHFLSPGFKQFSLTDTAEVPSSNSSLSNSSLLQQLNAVIPSKSTVYLFTDHQIVNLGEKLPVISYRLNWQETKSTDTLKKWKTAFGGKSYEAWSTPNSTQYNEMPGQKAEISVLWFQNENQADINYLKAGLSAIAEFTGRKIIVSKFDVTKKQQADVGFWLSDLPISADFKTTLKKNGRLFSYEKGTIDNTRSILNLGFDGQQVIELKKRIDVDDVTNEVLWTDGFGHAILTSAKIEDQQQFHFYSRFNIEWNDLVWNEQFVQALLPILISNEDFYDFGFEDNSLDQRHLPSTQAISIAGGQSLFSLNNDKKPIGNIFWIIAFAVLVVERVLTFNKHKNNYVKG